jgi:hypothetical protein
MDIPGIKRISGRNKSVRLGEGAKKMTSRVSHRSTTYPCFFPDLGEFSRSWSYRLANTKIRQHFFLNKPESQIPADFWIAQIQRVKNWAARHMKSLIISKTPTAPGKHKKIPVTIIFFPPGNKRIPAFPK